MKPKEYEDDTRTWTDVSEFDLSALDMKKMWYELLNKLGNEDK